MGYSCTQDASHMLGLIRHSFTDGSTGNGLRIGANTYFYEIGQEHADGRVTGSLFMNTATGFCRNVGSFCIAGDGRIVRFPRLKRNQMTRLYFNFLELKRVNPSLLNSYSHGSI